ncbi:MAG: GNAT family N-acetyltransferase [Chloroflexota bacterium]|nr:MAG: GNAT family N-acetyltransferase [Chloroflexota bacterium]
MYKLNEEQYARVQPLYESLRFNLLVDSVIDGNTPAWVFADDIENPRTALIWNRQDALLLAGDTENDEINTSLGDVIARQIIPDAHRRRIPGHALIYSPADWESKVTLLLPGLKLEKAQRRYYTSAQLRLSWQDHLPAGYMMSPLDTGLLENPNLANIHPPAGGVLSFWRSIHDFASTGFGYCILEGDTVAAWCLTVYASGNDYELGLATMPAYRNRGLATLVASACLEHCAVNGFKPHWHCWDDNLPSIAVAEKTGFENPVKYTVIRFDNGLQ